MKDFNTPLKTKESKDKKETQDAPKAVPAK
jgi:hypothetical protein